MGTEIIKKHNFQKTLKRLKAFSERQKEEIEIKSVATYDFGLMGLFFDSDHKVTGREFNDRIEDIQNILIRLNKKNIEIVKEFNDIYETFDYLDKEYISAILSVLKGLEKTSDDVKVQQTELKKHHAVLERQQNKLDSHQGEIDNIISNMEITIKVLQKFKSQLDNLKHLNEIDTIWKDCKDIQTKIELISENFATVNEASLMKINNLKTQLNVLSKKNDNDTVRVETIEQDIAVLKKDIISKDTKIGKEIDNIQTSIEQYNNFYSKLKEQIHILEIDTLWDKLDFYQKITEKLQIEGEEVNQKIEAVKDKINILNKNDISSNLKLELIEKDIDKLKNDISSKEGQLDVKINEIQSLLNEHDIYQSKLKTQIHMIDIDTLWDIVENYQVKLEHINRKVQRGYIVSGGALIIAISAIILNLTW
ncbi:hypothetical protein [Veillonella sp.]|jgi:hypothetical protein|uniref:hypothetical protein n=1 Tax=Veillonella sp. TaxID=1926307 RepID=UPI002904DF39|nr:hypothetical protein [Veillonella sp.]MDU2302148.1 hypothetical protein [Veillonella sp.]MDU2388946.1 hypothetical protein [Veillonella sp.]